MFGKPSLTQGYQQSRFCQNVPVFYIRVFVSRPDRNLVGTPIVPITTAVDYKKCLSITLILIVFFSYINKKVFTGYLIVSETVDSKIVYYIPGRFIFSLGLG